MKIDNLTTISSLADFLDGNQPVAFSISPKKLDKYKTISKILSRFGFVESLKYSSSLLNIVM